MKWRLPSGVRICAQCCPIFPMHKQEKRGHPMRLLLERTRQVAIVALVIGLRCTGYAAGEAKTDAAVSDAKAIVDASDPLRTLRGEVDNVDAAYAAFMKMTGDAEKEQSWKTYTQTNDSVVPKILDGVRQSPTSPTAFGLLEWVVTNGRISIRPLRPYGLQAIEILRDHFTSQTNISSICRELGLFGDPLNQPTVEFLQTAAAKNPNRSARGAANFALALLTKREAEGMAFCEIAPPSIYTNVVKTRDAFRDAAKTPDPEVVLHQAEQLFQTVKTDYSDVPNFPPGPGLRKPESTLGEQASIELYECQHLTTGKVAPEIQGEDIEGHKLRLSDYRGKVVIVSFWASWCGPCMQMVPHERAMAERLAGKPFVLIGVNGDSEKAAAKRAMTEQKMTWQSFWNDGSSEGGIAGALNVHSWPTVYVLDSKGKIRLKFDGYGGKKTDALLDAVVDQLLEETKGQ